MLGCAPREEAEKAGLVVQARAIDLPGPNKENLLSDELFLSLIKGAREGEWDASHAGPRCGIFSTARWNSSGQGPPPVTSKTESIYMDLRPTKQDFKKRLTMARCSPAAVLRDQEAQTDQCRCCRSIQAFRKDCQSSLEVVRAHGCAEVERE